MSSVRLDVRRVPWRAAAIAVLGLSGLAIVAEAVGRSPVGRRWLPAPTWGFSRIFDVKMSRLEERLDSGWVPTCLVVGSSMAAEAVDPDALADAGGPRCFNLGVHGLPESASVHVVAAVGRRAPPALVVVGLTLVVDSARLLRGADAEVARSLEAGAWGSRSVAWRYLVLARTLVRPKGSNLDGDVSPWGVMRWPVTAPDLDAYLREHRATAVRDQLKGPGDFAWIAALGRSPYPCVLIEMPVHPRALEAVGPAVRGRHLRRARAVAARAGVPLVTTQSEILLPDHAWRDGNHLAPDGARAFSRWLAGRLRAP